MKLVKIVIKLLLGATVFLGLVFVLAGFLIPGERSFTQETIIKAPPKVVWLVLRDVESFPEWQDKLSSVKIVDKDNWIEISKDAGPLKFKVVRQVEPDLLEISYSTQSGVKGEWLAKLKSTADGNTSIITRDKMSVESWIAKIFMSMFFDLEGFASDWNGKLKKRVETINPQIPKLKVPERPSEKG